MSKFNYVLFAFVAIGLAFYFIRKLPKFNVGEKATDFSATTLYGEELTLSGFEGQYVLLDFWGSWCPPCRKENPALVNLLIKHQDNEYKDATAFQIVSVSVETKQKLWENAIQKDGLFWKHHISSIKRFNDPIVEAYGVKEIPTKYFIGPDFTILGVNWTVREIDDYLTKQIKS